MRIIGYIDDSSLKITVFKMDNKISIKFEDGLYEQTFKFREREGLSTINDVQKLVEEKFVARVYSNFDNMRYASEQAMIGLFPEEEEEDDFEDII